MSEWSHLYASATSFFALATGEVNEQQGQKKGVEDKRGMDHAGSLLQSPLTHTPGVPPYTIFIPQSVSTICRFLHATTLRCLPLDKNVDAMEIHDGNLTEGLFHAGAACWRHTTPAKQTKR